MKRLLEWMRGWKYLPVAIVLCLLIGGILLYDSKEDPKEFTEEAKLERLLSEIEGVGRLSLYISEGEQGEKGVVVVCDGANNIAVRIEILNAVATALNIPKGCISICEMK